MHVSGIAASTDFLSFPPLRNGRDRRDHPPSYGWHHLPRGRRLGCLSASYVYVLGETSLLSMTSTLTLTDVSNRRWQETETSIYRISRVSGQRFHDWNQDRPKRTFDQPHTNERRIRPSVIHQARPITITNNTGERQFKGRAP